MHPDIPDTSASETTSFPAPPTTPWYLQMTHRPHALFQGSPLKLKHSLTTLDKAGFPRRQPQGFGAVEAGGARPPRRTPTPAEA